MKRSCAAYFAELSAKPRMGQSAYGGKPKRKTSRMMSDTDRQAVSWKYERTLGIEHERYYQTKLEKTPSSWFG